MAYAVALQLINGYSSLCKTVITSTEMITTDQILKILRSHPFSRFSMSQLKLHHQPQVVEDLLTTLSSDQEIHDVMVELPSMQIEKILPHCCHLKIMSYVYGLCGQ